MLVFLALGALVTSVYGHNVSKEDIAALSVLSGVQVIHYMWLGAKHMVTGYDHLLFLLGVIYYIKQFNDVFVLVSLFALGHSVTLILGVTLSWAVSPYLVDVALFCALLILTLMPVFRNHRQTAIVVNAMLVMLGCTLMFYQLRLYYLAA